MASPVATPRDFIDSIPQFFSKNAVTVLITIAMIAYLIISQALELDDLATGVFLGGTIHDLAQVVGAGFSIINETGETATLVKLIRVAMLAPVVSVFSLVIRSYAEADPEPDGKKPPLPLLT